MDSGPSIGFRSLRNLTTGSPLGASQVTAVVTVNSTAEDHKRRYPVAWRARLAAPYFIRLRTPVDIDVTAMLDAVAVGLGPISLASCVGDGSAVFGLA
jgi:hypothetical protein